MTKIFLQLVSLSKIISIMIIAVLILRVVFRKAPKKLHKILWLLVGIRASIPFYLRSKLGVIPAHTVSSTVSNQTIVRTEPVTRVVGVDDVVSRHSDVVSRVDITAIVTYVWIAGVCLFLLYLLVNYIRMRKSVSEAVRVHDDVFASDNIPSPFILGYIKPRIYIYPDMDQKQQELIVAHERCHLKYMDHILKLLGFVLLGVYWFNPLMWLAYFVFCKDIELACDENVISSLPFDRRKEYAIALLDSAHKANVLIYGVAFSENSVKERVVSVMNYKKPKFWIIVAAIVACIAVIVLFFTVNKAPKNASVETEAEIVAESEYVSYEFETYDGQTIKIDESNIVSQNPEENVLETTLVPENAEVIAPGRDYVYLADDEFYYVEDSANGLLTVAYKGAIDTDPTDDIDEVVTDDAGNDGVAKFIKYKWGDYTILNESDSFYLFEDKEGESLTLSYDKEGVELAGSNVVTFQTIHNATSQDVIADKVKGMDGLVTDITELTRDGATIYVYSVVGESEGSELKTEQTYYTIQHGDDVLLIDEFRTVSPDAELDEEVSKALYDIIQSVLDEA